MGSRSAVWRGGSVPGLIGRRGINVWLRRVDLPDGARSDYEYDGLGRRVEKSTGSPASPTTVRYIYDNEDILAMLGQNNNPITIFTHGPGIDEPLIMKQGSEEFFYHADVLGSIVALSNEAGDVIERVEYQVYGEPVFIDVRGPPVLASRPFSGIPSAFTARELESDTGLYFYRGRYYQPPEARFLQHDDFRNAVLGQSGMCQAV